MALAKSLILATSVLVMGYLLASCGGVNASAQFQKANSKLSPVWSHYFDSLTALEWVEGDSQLTASRVNEWDAGSAKLRQAIARYDATIGPLASASPYRSDLEALVHAGTMLITDLSYPSTGRASKETCDNLNCYIAPLGGSDWSSDLTTAQEAETTVFSDFGIAKTSGGPYATPA